MRERLARLKDGDDILALLEAEAVGIHLSDREANLTMAQLGMELIRKHQGNPQVLLTHCNAGALATGGFGTALGVIRAAYLEGLVEQVYVDETRPWLQGARLTAWELAGDGVPVCLNADAAAAHGDARRDTPSVVSSACGAGGRGARWHATHGRRQLAASQRRCLRPRRQRC
jgi:methylthioribose-1-phosphate isomerase